MNRRSCGFWVGLIVPVLLGFSTLASAQVTYRLVITRPAPSPPSAREQAATVLRQQADQTRREINRAQARLRAEFESSEPVREARTALADARRAYDRARQQALEKLVDDPRYVAIQLQIHRLQVELHELHAQPSPRMDLIHAQALRILQLRQEMSRMQTEVIEQDEDALIARFAMLDAASAYWQLEAEFAQRVRGDPSVAQSRRQLLEVRQAMASIRS